MVLDPLEDPWDPTLVAVLGLPWVMLDAVFEAILVSLEVAVDPVVAVSGSLEVGLDSLLTAVLVLLEVPPNDNYK